MKGSGRAKRHAERKLAVQVLYSLTFASPLNMPDLRRAYENSPAKMAGEGSAADAATEEKGRMADEDYSWRLVNGVWSNLALLDESIDRFSTNWRRDRMGRVELAILRLALYELLMEKIEGKVVISEAKTLCREFDVGDAAQLIHGIVDAALREQANDCGANAADPA